MLQVITSFAVFSSLLISPMNTKFSLNSTMPFPPQTQLPKLTTIRLSNFYPSVLSPSVNVIRLLWVVDSYKESNKAYDYYQSAGAVNFALKRLATENVLNISLIDLEVAHVAVDDRSCSAAGDLNALLRVYTDLDYKFDAIVGPQCVEGALAVSAFAESLRKPHILWVATHPEFSNKQRYPYVTQNAVATDLVAECMVEMFRQLGNWTHAGYLYDRDDYICKNLVWLTLQNLIKKGTKNFTITYSAGLSGINSTDDQIHSVLLEAAKVARIMLVCSGATQDYNTGAKTNRYNSFLLRLMSQAYVVGMHTGEYQWIAQRPMLLNNLWPPYAPIKVNASDVANEHYSLQSAIGSLNLPVTEAQLYEVFRSFLEFDQVFGSLTDDSAFDQEVMGAAFRPPWNVNRTEFDGLVKSSVLTNHTTRFANYLADGIYLYGLGLRMAMDKKLDYTSSAVMRSLFLNITFQGKTGPFSINNDGKRFSDLALYVPVQDFYQQHPLKRFEVQAIMRCASLPLAERAAGSAGNLDLLRPLEWYGAIGSRAPPDTPVCGWKNEHCLLLSTTGVVLVACVGAFAVLLCVSLVYVFIRRKQRFAAILNTDWNLRQADLTWPKSTNSFSRRTVQSNASSSSVKTDNSESDVMFSRSTLASANNNGTSSALNARNLAMYKENSKVFVKPIYLRPVPNSEVGSQSSKLMVTVANLPLSCLKELRGMKDADHDNINRFVGIVVNSTPTETSANRGSEAMLAVNAYCAKGTLAQVLYGSMNDDEVDFAAAVPTLDYMFKLSFVNDIANGVNYLHNVSSLKWHGRLSSSTIAIDGRWTAKLTNFGFWSFGRNCSTNSWIKEADDERLLWVAPEILRDPDIVVQMEQDTGKSTVGSGNHAVRFRQAADIYSLSVVFGEILRQTPPYRHIKSEKLTIQGIVRSVALGQPRRSSEKDEVLSLNRPYSDSAFVEAHNQNKTVSSENEKVARNIRQLMYDCWQESPQARPTIRQVLRRLAKIGGKPDTMSWTTLSANWKRIQTISNILYKHEQVNC